MNGVGPFGGWPARADDWRRLALRSPLVYVTDAHAATPAAAVTGALAGGVGMVLYRPHTASGHAAVLQASQLVWLCRAVRVPLLVHGRVDVALAAMADGVHLEPDDIAPALVRRIMGPAAIIGVTCHTPSRIREAARSGANFVSFGELGAHPEQAETGDRQLHRLARSRQLAICVSNKASEAVAQLVGPDDLVAVSDAITQAANPRRAAAELVSMLRSATTASRTADEAACHRSGTARPPSNAPAYRPPYAIPPAESQ